jgi:hypothetical protein
MEFTLDDLKAAYNAGRYSAENLPKADPDGVFFQFLENLQAGQESEAPVEQPAKPIEQKLAPAVIAADPEVTSSTPLP